MSKRKEAHAHIAPPGIGAASELYCLVPPELAELSEELERSLPEDAPFEVLVDRRRGERRTGTDRRGDDRAPPSGTERRLATDIEGRRFAERRSLLVPVNEIPPLPAPVRPHADRLRFVRRGEFRRRMEEVDRVRDLAQQWRERCRETAHEAAANLVRRRTEGRHALSAAMATRDAYTWEHSAAVVWLALKTAKEIGLADEAMGEIHDVALLHDIGKLAIPDSILQKHGPLSETEWEVICEHPVMGAELLDSVDTLRHLAPAVRAEHERWDGRGYPDGLGGEQIPISSRIVFVCDAYHAMVSERPYRKPLSPAEARAELAANAGAQFWPDAAAALLRVLERSEPRDLSRIGVPSRSPSAGGRTAEPRDAVKRDPSPREAVSPAVGAESSAGEIQEAGSAAQRLETAWRTAMQQRDALRYALEGLLEATRQRHGYSPRAFVARVRAERALRRIYSPADSED